MARTMKEIWDHAAPRLVPPTASKDQYEDMEKAFYCGASQIIVELLKEIPGPPHALIQGFRGQLLAFMEEHKSK